ncbi:excalibur calcium-binding domain-containing protein [Gallibacterium genomosp. 3]
MKYSCDVKRYCKEMRSCEEAKFYLNQCGVGRLDRDKDGVPCESICR